MPLPPLQPDTSFHIFNHANGFENVFNKEDNFRYFLEKYQLYISPIAETYAYCLMPNHFHLVIRIRKRRVIEELIISNQWEFSSYNEIVDGVCNCIEITKLFKMTDGIESFKEIHRRALDHFNERYDLEIP